MMKKLDRLIAIIMNMEKTSIRPTYEMMLILYEAYVKDESQSSQYTNQ